MDLEDTAVASELALCEATQPDDTVDTDHEQAGAGEAAVESTPKAADKSAVDDDDPLSAAKKVRIAVLFGYLGTNYQGLQKNPGAKTVEDALEKAIQEAGCIPKSWYGNLHQVVSFKAVLPDGGEDELRDKISAGLPDDMKCIDVVRVIANFNAKNQCSSRQYEYLLPTFVLEPINSSFRTRSPPMSEAAKKLLASNSSNCDGEVSDAYTRGEVYAAALKEYVGLAADPSKACAAPLRMSILADFPTPGHVQPVYMSNTADAAPDDYQSGAAFDRAQKQVWAISARAEEIRRTCGYRITPDAHKQLSNLFGQYVGTKAFHNFTPRMTFGDASTCRFISDARVSKPFVVGEGKDQLEYVKFTLVGQSFLYNQIRHMVGLVADIVRGAAPGNMMDVAFSHGVVKLPLAPAEGLYLAHCNFTGYDKRYAIGQFRSLTYLSPEANRRMEDFRDNFVAKQVHESVLKDRPFHKYLAELTGQKYKVFIPPQLAQVLARAPSFKSGIAVHAGEKRPRPEEPADAEKSAAKKARPEATDTALDLNDERMTTFALHHIVELMLTPADPRFFSGLSFSKTAKEKTEFKQKLRNELYEYEKQKYGPRDDAVPEVDAVADDDEAGSPPNRGRGRGRGRGGLTKGRGHWWRGIK